MYAITEVGGKQYVVSKGDTIVVEKLPVEEKSEYVIDKVLLLKTDEGKIEIGKPYIPNAKILTEVTKQTKTKKVIVFRKSEPKKNWRRKMGHRQNVTVLKIKEITIN